MKIWVLSLRNLSSLQHPETTLAALRNTHWPTSLSWVDKHWDDLAMYLLFICLLNPNSPKSPCICPTSLFLSLSPAHSLLSLSTILLAILSFIKRWAVTVSSQPFHSFSVILSCKNMAARGWWETKGACCLLWLSWLSVCSSVKTGQVSFFLGQRQ